MKQSTKQRTAIKRCFGRGRRPLTPTKAYSLTSTQLPALRIATAYRTIGALVANGTLNPIVVGGITGFDFKGRSRHHHFHCCCCEKVSCPPGQPLQPECLAPPGCVVDSHELVLTGYRRSRTTNSARHDQAA